MTTLDPFDYVHRSVSDHVAAIASGHIGLPVIGARTSMADVLRLLGHAAAGEALRTSSTFTNRRVHRGCSLVLSGQGFENLYLVLAGSFKSTLNEADGTQQIVAFPMRGDVIGMEAFVSDRHTVSVAALEEAHVTVLPQRELTALIESCTDFQVAMRKAVSAEFVRNFQAMRAMGALGAEARLARFLFDMGQRLARFGFSSRAFRLPMSRADIASYLGLSIETVSRAFTSLSARGIIAVDRHSICIVERERLGRTEEFEPHSLQALHCGHVEDHRHREVAVPALN